jgi:prepilin-type N-terminal cleavage/methylation domain-containing protein
MSDTRYFDRDGFTGDAIGDVLIWSRAKFNMAHGNKSELDRLNLVLEKYGGHYCNSLNTAMFEAEDLNPGLVYGCKDRRTDYKAEENKVNGSEWVPYRYGYVSCITGEYCEGDHCKISYPVWCLRQPSFTYKTAGEMEAEQGFTLLEMLLSLAASASNKDDKK